MKQVRIPRNIRAQTPAKLLEASYTLPAAGQHAAGSEDPIGLVDQIAVPFQDRIVNVAAGQEISLAPDNPNRQYLLVINLGTVNNARISFGQPATTATGLPLAANGGFYEPLKAPSRSISAFSASGTQLLVIEG